jgi:pimeloyl-ACP methyl ester carboxylesterase
MAENWVFLRGLARSSEHWNDFPERFREAFPGTEIEVLDIAGNGGERGRASFTSIHDNVEDLRARSRLLLRGPVNLCAISMGAMMAMDWADRYPGDIRRVVLMNASDRRHGAFYERMQPSVYLPFLSMILDPNPLRRERKVMRMTTSLFADPENLAQKHARMAQTRVLDFFRQLWAASRFRSPVRKPAMPLLILAGARDGLAKSICSKRLADEWQAEFHLHLDAAHDLPLEAPDWILQQIQSWIAKVP